MISRTASNRSVFHSVKRFYTTTMLTCDTWPIKGQGRYLLLIDEISFRSRIVTTGHVTMFHRLFQSQNKLTPSWGLSEAVKDSRMNESYQTRLIHFFELLIGSPSRAQLIRHIHPSAINAWTKQEPFTLLRLCLSKFTHTANHPH